MNIWANAVITQKGLALQAKLIEGTTLQITEVQIGAGYVTPGLLMQQTAVSDPKKTIQQVDGIGYPEEGKCSIKISITNDDVNTGYTAKQVGIYATDPDEGKILYFIAQAENNTGTVVPSNTEMPGFSAEWTFYFQYGNADNVSVIVSPSNTVSRTEMTEYVEEHTDPKGSAAAAQQAAAQALSAHTRDKNNPHGVTAEQVGADPAGSAAAVQSNLTEHASNKNNPHNVTAAQVGADPAGSAQAVQSNLNTHANNKSNPHGVTAAQVGAIPTAQKGAAGGVASLGSDGKVPETQLPEMDYDPAGSAAAVQAILNAHANNKSNPHGVTAAQVGAAPAYTYGTSDLTAGSSSLATGKLYFVYEE